MILLELFAVAALDQLRDVNGVLAGLGKLRNGDAIHCFPKRPDCFHSYEKPTLQKKNPEPKEPMWPISSLQTAN